MENSLIPLPSEFIVTPAAYKAANGELSIGGVLCFSTAGALAGALFNYYLAKHIGRPLVFRLAASGIGRFCLLSPTKIEKAECYFIKHGSLSTFIGRLVPAVRQIISIPAGLARMKIKPFILYTLLGAAIWNSILIAIGIYLARILPQDQLLEQIKKYSSEIGSLFLIIALGFIAYLICKKKNSASH